jgi:hypothetical protein
MSCHCHYCECYCHHWCCCYLEHIESNSSPIFYSTLPCIVLSCSVLKQSSVSLDYSLSPNLTQYITLNVHHLRWFLFGSIFITAASAIVLANSYNEVIGTDDSFLSRPAFRASWALLVVSGAFCTVGSFAFVRAMNNPPMASLFSCKHCATDELFGSWMFALATFPLVPYCLLFLWVQNDFVYLAMLAFSVLSFLGACLFVRGSYPVTNESSKSKILSCLGYCFGHRRFLMKHFATDWLVGTWLVFWATAVGTVGLFFFTIYYLAIGASSVSAFANISTFLDCVIFLIGSAYFVAGSYPRYDSDDVIDIYCEQDGIDLECAEGSGIGPSYMDEWGAGGGLASDDEQRHEELRSGMLFSSTVAPGRILPAGQTSGMSQSQGRMNALSEVTSPFSYKGGSGSSSDVPRIKPPNPVSQPPSYRPPALPPLEDIFEVNKNNSSNNSNNSNNNNTSNSNSVKLSYDDINKSGKGSNNNIGKSFSYEGVRRDVGTS